MLSERLKILREQTGHSTQESFANYLGYEKQYVQKYESGKNKPTTEFYIALIKKTDLNLRWLLTGEGEMYMNGKSESELSKENRELRVQLENYKSMIATVKNNLKETEADQTIIKNRKKKHSITLNNYRYSLN